MPKKKSKEVVTKPSSVVIAKYNQCLSNLNARLINKILQQYRKTNNRVITAPVASYTKEGCLVDRGESSQIEQLTELMSLVITVDFKNAEYSQFYTKVGEQSHLLLSYGGSVFENYKITKSKSDLENTITFTINKGFTDILNCTELYTTTLSLGVLKDMTSYGIRLFEILTAYWRASQYHCGYEPTRVITIPIDKLKVLFGVDKTKTYKTNKAFISQILKPKLQEIMDLQVNPKQDIKLLYFGSRLFETVKSGRNITDIQFLVKRPTSEKPPLGERDWTPEEKEAFDKRDNLRKLKTSSAKLSQAGLPKEEILGEVEETVDGTEKIIKKRQAKTDEIIKLFIDN